MWSFDKPIKAPLASMWIFCLFQIVSLLIEFEADVNNKDVYGATPLHRAASQGRTNIVDILLQNPNIQIDSCEVTGSTPL